ncbi:MAG: DUF3016 domain-containing protein [Opitutales bacterium]
MTRIPTLLALVAGLLAATAVQATSVDIRWNEADAYTDLSDNGATTEKTLPVFQKELTAFLERQAADRLPPGYTLALHIQDVDMAGEREPWRSVNNPDIRYLRDIYPPSLVFAYAIRDAEGRVVRSGEAKALDLNYRFGPHILANSTLFYYEKEVMRVWIRKNLNLG